MAAILKGVSTTYDETLPSLVITANTWYRVVGSVLIHNSISYTNENIFYSGIITTVYIPFGDTTTPIALLAGVSTTYDLSLYYFTAEGTKVAYESNDIGIHKYSGYLLEVNPTDLAPLKALHGYGAGDKLTFNEIIRLTIDYPANIIADFNQSITTVNKNSGALTTLTAYLCITLGTTNFSSFTSDTIAEGKAFITSSAGTPTWTGGTVIQEILMVQNLYTVFGL